MKNQKRPFCLKKERMPLVVTAHVQGGICLCGIIVLVFLIFLVFRLFGNVDFCIRFESNAFWNDFIIRKLFYKPLPHIGVWTFGVGREDLGTFNGFLKFLRIFVHRNILFHVFISEPFELIGFLLCPSGFGDDLDSGEILLDSFQQFILLTSMDTCGGRKSIVHSQSILGKIDLVAFHNSLSFLITDCLPWAERLRAWTSHYWIRILPYP